MISTHSLQQDPVYTILLQLRDMICVEQLKHLSTDTTNGTSLTNQNCLELIVLRSEERKPQPPSSGCVSASSSCHMTSSVSADSVKASSRHPGLPRQKSHDLSELEEDEDDDPVARSPLPVSTSRHKRGKLVRLVYSAYIDYIYTCTLMHCRA